MALVSGTVPLDTQVGGHAGVLSSADGSVVIKPCLPLEIEFYNAVSSDPDFSHLAPFVPKFYGTLKLQGKMDEQGNIGVVAEGEEEEPEKDEFLQNLAHSFGKPNIIDIKLGTVLWDEHASLEKRQRMEKAARETTSLDTGVRLTGFEVYDHTEGKFSIIPKSYGKSIKAEDLPSGIAKFFPLATSDVPRGQGLPKEPLLQVLRRLVAEVKSIKSAVHATEMRMVGGSLLVIYEADWDRLRKALDEWPKSSEDDALGEDDNDDDNDDASEDDAGTDASDGAEDEAQVGPPCTAKLIDFAHTSVKKGQGPDEGVLLGLDTITSLLQGRIDQLETDSLSQ